MEVGKKYRFDPPIRTVGFKRMGNAVKRFLNMRFPVGICVEIGEFTTRFEAGEGDHRYWFHSIGQSGGSRVTEIA